ncbi:MAG: tRNA uridine(34) 5-carboxymethylaminomethyl modification radical SAM/GNAT enzyme Elp3 [Dehalococcoidales bacterium]|nr:tRNA uridine(34) 5-carboxymethylaminomethyl modification radical SAM/GNAT enzyme Elp3 [Dehalococcoidales bacterium]
MKKTTRTISGITPVAVMARPMGCPGKCIYCPTFSATPQSYTPESPAVLRARACDYSAGKQVESRMGTLTEMGHPTDKIELIIMGGTFLSAPEDYQYNFIRECYDALNGTQSTSLEEARRTNETAIRRCTGLCIETRPDFCGENEIRRMLEFGTTRVEIGVQILNDEVYRIVRRGHGVEDVVKSSALLREQGLKVHYHLMPGLPGSSPEEDLRLSALLFEDSRFRPDGLKIYPTMVIEGTELENWYRQGLYQPYQAEVMMDLIAKIKALVPKYVRISRVLRDIPPKFIVGGLKDSLRDPLKSRMEQMGLTCHCIRCREYGFRTRDGHRAGEPRLTRLDYQASDGNEIFLSFEDEEETLFGLLRLRIQGKKPLCLPENTTAGTALVRELHVYGPELPLSQRDESSAQHRGFGRALLREAERIAREEFGRERIAVLSGVGAREYYRNEGYDPAGAYMIKLLSNQR